jgi:DNA invertase Pin-like site-specific DNA recombinase
MKAALYARVSTQNHHQDPEVQLRELRGYAELKGWEIVGEYVDRGISGTKESRPELNRLMADAGDRKFDAMLVWKFDRFARSARHMQNTLHELQQHDIAFVSTTENIDTSTPMGKCVFTILSALAEMERHTTVERIKAGLKNAKAKGHVPGRKPQAIDMRAVRARIAVGESQRQIAKSLGVSPALLNKKLKGVRP